MSIFTSPICSCIMPLTFTAVACCVDSCWVQAALLAISACLSAQLGTSTRTAAAACQVHSSSASPAQCATHNRCVLATTAPLEAELEALVAAYAEQHMHITRATLVYEHPGPLTVAAVPP